MRSGPRNFHIEWYDWLWNSCLDLEVLLPVGGSFASASFQVLQYSLLLDIFVNKIVSFVG